VRDCSARLKARLKSVDGAAHSHGVESVSSCSQAEGGRQGRVPWKLELQAGSRPLGGRPRTWAQGT
jgi:hypothetical protein